MPRDEQNLHVVALSTSADNAAILVELLEATGQTAVWSTDVLTGETELLWYTGSPAEAEATGAALGVALAGWQELLPHPLGALSVRTLPREDWAESWKRHFKVTRVSPRLIIRPSWEAVTPGPEERVIVLDPGMSFGTGQHPTTQACLEFLDELSAAAPAGGGFLDIGCGTGILAIAAALLGRRPVAAFDHDPQCLISTRDNARANGVGRRVRARHLDLADWQPKQHYPIIAANLLADLLVRYAAPIAASLPARGPGWLLVAGVLTPQYPAVLAAFAAHGLHELRHLTVGEWTSGCLHRPGR